MDFDVLALPAEPWLLHLPRMRDGGAVYLNGRLLGVARESDADTYVRWMRPYAFSIAPSQLQVGRNLLHVRIRARDAYAMMSAPQVGPEAVVRPILEARLFSTRTAVQMTAATTIALAVFVIGVWLRRRLAFDYGLFGLAALFWGLHTANYLVEAVPVWAWLPWRVIRYASTGGFVVALALFMLDFAGIRRRGLTRFLVAFWLCGPLLLLLGGEQWHAFVDRYYQAGLILVAIFMAGVTLQAGWRRRTPGAVALCAMVVVGIALGMHDYLVSQRIWLDPEQPLLLVYGANGFLLVMGVLLANRFATSLGAAERISETPALKVAEKERELAASYARMREHERERNVNQERQRMMRDMHDGLGSQLLGSLVAVERGSLDSKGMAQALRDAIDEMRLTIDSLVPGHEGLLVALGNLRHRQEPRFRAAGVALSFTQHGVPAGIDIPADHLLQILRLLQEALANVLKHAAALHVRIAVGTRGDLPQLFIEVFDDGRGFDPNLPGLGRGLPNMGQRARQIDATLAIVSGLQGTKIALSYPLTAPAYSPGLSKTD